MLITAFTKYAVISVGICICASLSMLCPIFVNWTHPAKKVLGSNPVGTLTIGVNVGLQEAAHLIKLDNHLSFNSCGSKECCRVRRKVLLIIIILNAEMSLD